MIPLTINWPSIRAQAACGDYLTRETGINEIMALLSGECLEISPTKLTFRSYWDPRLVAQQPPYETFPDAVAALRDTTTAVVSAWASAHRKILLALSGGLDSSVVLGRLAGMQTPPELLAINFHSRIAATNVASREV